MNRSLAALVGCLALPALGVAQSDGTTIPDAPLYPSVKRVVPVRPAPARLVSPYNAQPIRPQGSEPTIAYPSQQAPPPLPITLMPQTTPLTGPSLGTPQSRSWDSFKPLEGQGPAITGALQTEPKTVPPMPEVIKSAPPVLANPTPAPKRPDVTPATPPTTQPRVLEPKVAEPRVIEPKFVAPKVAEPKVILPKAAEPKGPMGAPMTLPPPATQVPMTTPPMTTPQTVIPGTVPVVPATPAPVTITPAPVPATVSGAPATLPAVTYPKTHAESLIQSPTQACINGQCGPISSSCEPCVCGPYGRFWVGAEYLYWTAKGSRVPALVTTSPAGTPVESAGVIGTPGARVLFGGNRLNDDWRSGVRLRGGFWLNDAQTTGLDFGGFYLGRGNSDFTAASAGSPILSRPFTNVPAGTQAAELVAFPGIVSGRVSVGSGNQVYGFDPNLRTNLFCDPCGRLDLLLGYRYLRMQDSLSVREDLLATDPAGVRAPFGTQITVLDQFAASNTFHGGQVGLAGERRFGNFFVGGRFVVAAGNTHQEVQISGQTQIRETNGNRTNLVGGLLAQRSNIGSFSRDAFSVIPELGLNLGVQVSPNLRIYGGYSFLYWTNVVRAGEQIDTGVNPTGIPRAVPPSALQGPARPLFSPRDNDFFLHGLSAGLELRF